MSMSCGPEDKRKKVMLPKDRADFLNNILGGDRLACLRGKTVSIITRRKEAKIINLERVARRLGAVCVVLDSKYADFTLVDLSLHPAVFQNPEYPGIALPLEKYEDLVFGTFAV
ncbi:MAG: hypothetical protein HQM09_17540 [Candidatus Riflebacteria bacterium]|nr:hypothetical protein [Candidatus Riflebacteria bacterium]